MAKKLNYNKSGDAAARKARLREEAEERQRLREQRTPEQQLALLKTRRGNSTRESMRLWERKS